MGGDLPTYFSAGILPLRPTYLFFGRTPPPRYLMVRNLGGPVTNMHQKNWPSSSGADLREIGGAEGAALEKKSHLRRRRRRKWPTRDRCLLTPLPTQKSQRVFWKQRAESGQGKRIGGKKKQREKLYESNRIGEGNFLGR